MSITRADLQAALDGKIENRFLWGSNEMQFLNFCEINGCACAAHLRGWTIDWSDLAFVLENWSLPVVEQPAPAVIWEWDGKHCGWCNRHLFADGTVKVLRSGEWEPDILNYHEADLAKFAASKYAECAEKDALIEKYRAVAEIARLQVENPRHHASKLARTLAAVEESNV